MTTLDNNFYKALGMIEPGSVELLMKTEPDVDKVLAALPEIDQKVVAGLKKYDQFDPALIYAIKAIVDKQKETRNFCAGWSPAQERAKAAKKIVDKINFAQTVASTALTVDTHGVRLDGLDENFAEQKAINKEVRQDLSFNAGEHNALKGRVQRTEQDVGKLEGETGMAKNVIDTMRERDAAMAHQQSEKDREWRQEIREAAKWENEANAKKMEADAMEQERDEWKAKCETMVAQKEVLLATIAERQRDNAVLEAQLKHKKEDAAELARARREVEAAKQRESDRKEREAKDRRKSAEAAKEVAAEARAKTMAAELERDTVRRENDALTSKVKELDARVRTADERAATLDAKKEELAAKLKAETRAKDVLADAEARTSAELGEAKIALRQARDQQSTEADKLREKHALLEATLETTRAELKAREEKLDEARRASEAAGAKAAECNALRAELEASRAECAALAAQSMIQVAVAAQVDGPNLGLDAIRRRRRDGVCRPLRLECSQRNLGAWRAAADGRGHAVECHVVEVARRLTDRARQHQHEHGHHDPRPDKLRRPRGQRKPRQVGRRGQAEEGSRED